MSAIFGQTMNFSQENGPDVILRVFGDERYARYENTDGFSVIYDYDLGLFCYAALEGNQLVSTGIFSEDLPPKNIVRHLQESLLVKLAKKEKRQSLHHPTAFAFSEKIVKTFGPNQGLLEGRQLSIGAVRGLTILVNFQDVKSLVDVDDVQEMLNGVNYNGNGNICSVREYFLKVSSGKLEYTNIVVGPYTLSRSRNFYINNLLVEEALNLAVADGLDLTQFDSRNEGILDALNILYAGQSLYQGELWPHNFNIDLRFGNISTNLYLLTGLGRNSSELTIGTFCHENGHLLCRFPDMYDYGPNNREGDDKESAGIGYYCLMGAGNHLGDGRSPAPVCAYLRDLAGWCDNVVDLNADDVYVAEHGTYNTIMKYKASRPNEYFLVENRNNISLDRDCPASGLAIYHCDKLGSNEFQQGTALRHYQCALLQADGHKELEQNINQGDGADLFGSVDGLALSSSTNPNTNEWDGRDSGLIISNIVNKGSEIIFQTGQLTQSDREKELASHFELMSKNKESTAAKSITISESGVARRIKLYIEIQGTAEEKEASFELFAPNRRRAILHIGKGNIHEGAWLSYDSDLPGNLSTLIGQPTKGSWSIYFPTRNATGDVYLKNWSIEIESAPF